VTERGINFDQIIFECIDKQQAEGLMDAIWNAITRGQNYFDLKKWFENYDNPKQVESKTTHVINYKNAFELIVKQLDLNKIDCTTCPMYVDDLTVCEKPYNICCDEFLKNWAIAQATIKE